MTISPVLEESKYKNKSSTAEERAQPDYNSDDEYFTTELNLNLSSLNLNPETDNSVINDTNSTTQNQNGPIKKISKKQRKGQSEEDYLIQKEIYKQTGPKITSLNWLFEKEYDMEKLHIKMERGDLRNAAERAFFLRDYSTSLKYTQMGINAYFGNKTHKRDLQELENIKIACEKQIYI